MASLRIEKFSITSGARAFRSYEEHSTPSVRISGFCAASAKVLTPRIQKLAPSAPGSPDCCTEITPAMRPAKLFVRLAAGIFMSEVLNDWIAPMTLSFFCCPNPTTTTSSITRLSSLRTMLQMLSAPGVISWFR